jgi:hypothetical protein
MLSQLAEVTSSRCYAPGIVVVVHDADDLSNVSCRMLVCISRGQSSLREFYIEEAEKETGLPRRYKLCGVNSHWWRQRAGLRALLTTFSDIMSDGPQ